MTIGVLFVCTGNICRSPMAEGVFRSMARQAGLDSAFTVDSAGTYDGHTGEPPSRLAIEAAARRGYDISGLPFHSDGQTVIKERIRLDTADRNVLYDEITVIDNAMTRPYSKIQKATRNPSPRPVWHSDVCSETNTHVQIENEPYYLSADGKLMPSKKNQAPPDLRYFKQTQK